jgi:hypothetical protein
VNDLFDNPLPAILIGGGLAVLFGFGWVQTGKRWPLHWMVVALLITFALVLVERWIVTDREQITQTLYDIADLVERNDINTAVQYVYSGSPEVRRQALAELPGYDFSEVNIKRNLEIEVLPAHIPPRAEARFNVTVVVSTVNGSFKDMRVPRFVQVTFLQEKDGRWRVAAYRHDDPREGFLDQAN